MTDIEILNNLVNEISDREKLDKVYNEILFPRLKMMALRLRKKRVDISDNCTDFKTASALEFIMDKKGFTLQNLIETNMRPYLEEKGFTIITSSPNYEVGISWK